MSTHAGTIGFPKSDHARPVGRLLVIFAVMVAAVAAGITALWVRGSTAPARNPAPVFSPFEAGKAGGPSSLRGHITYQRGGPPPAGTPASMHSRQLVP